MKASSLDLPRFGAGTGLVRTAAIAARLDLDLEALGRRAVVIAGSNGKGSVSRMLASLLRQGGEGVGLFTSPHLAHFNERFELSGERIDDASLVAIEDRVGAAIAAHLVDHPGDQPGAFEACFLAAMLWFHESGAERLVVEAGIGGRYDPTRLLKAPHAALVSLDAEHMPLLGTTLREVALDKFDVAPPGGHVVLGRSLERERVGIDRVAAGKGITTHWVGDGYELAKSVDDLHGHQLALRHAVHGNLDTLIAMHGRFQLDNLEVALDLFAAMRPDLFEKGWPSLIAPALAHCANPARLEFLDGQPGLLVDAGHTPEAIRAAVAGVGALLKGRGALLLLGVSADKPVATFVDAIAPAFDDVIISALLDGVPANLLAAAYSGQNTTARVRAVADPRTAIALAKQEAGDRIVVALGGLFWAAAIREAWVAATPPSCVD